MLLFKEIAILAKLNVFLSVISSVTKVIEIFEIGTLNMVKRLLFSFLAITIFHVCGTCTS